MPVDPATFKFETPQFDPRFPNQNQSKHCAQAYVDYHKCVNVKVKNLNHAKSFQNFHFIMPFGLGRKWDDQRAAGKFPVNMDA